MTFFALALQAEQDKLTALRALEARSIEMMKEKSEKRKLEHRIATLSSQMLAGGGAFAVDEDGNPVQLECVAFRAICVGWRLS